MAPSGRGRRRRRQRRAVRTDQPGAGGWGSGYAPASRSPCGLGAPPGQPHPPPAAAAAAPRAARLRRDLKRGSGRRRRRGPVRAGPAGQDGEPVTGWGDGRSRGGRREASGGRGGSAQPSKSGAWGRAGRRAGSRDGAPRFRGARAPDSRPPAPAARPRRCQLPGTERAAAGVGRRAGERAAPDLTHSPCPAATAEAAARRRGGSAAAGANGRAGSCRLAACTSAGACARGARETHALTHPYTPERRAGRGRPGTAGDGRGGARRGAAAHRRPRLHARAPGGGGAPPGCSPLAALQAPRHQSPGHQFINKAKGAREQGGSVPSGTGPRRGQTPCALAWSSPRGRSHLTPP